MTVINTSPAIHLHAVLPGGLALLPDLIGQVIIPWEVGQELAAGHTKDNTWLEIQSVPGLIHRSASVAIHPLLASQIDLGEASVIQPALDEGSDTVILDELKARRLATAVGLHVTGTLGLLVQARRSGHLPSVRKAVTALEHRGMWIAPALVRQAIQLAGE
jgi:predicted nucleic acid-binding protein